MSCTSVSTSEYMPAWCAHGYCVVFILDFGFILVNRMSCIDT